MVVIVFQNDILASQALSAVWSTYYRMYLYMYVQYI